MSKTTVYRVHRVDELIRSGKYPNRQYLSAELEVTVRTIQRDLDFMRDQLGAPIAFDAERGGYYYTQPDWFLPTVRLTEGDLFSLLIARQAIEQYRGTPVARELDRIFARIAGAMNDKIHFDGSMLAPLVTFSAPPAMSVNETVWNAVLQGARDSRVVVIGYRKPGAVIKEHRACPLNIVNLQGEWYVLAGNLKNSNITQYAMGRIETARVTRLPFDRPRDFNVSDWLANGFGRFANPAQIEDVRLLFDAEVAPWIVNRVWHPKQVLTNRPDGTVELAFPSSGGGNRPFLSVLTWVLSFGCHVRVLAPDTLAKLVREEVERMHRMSAP